MRKGAIGGFTLIVVFIIATIAMFMMTESVPAGYVAVQYSMNGGIKDEVLTQGFHIIPPTVKTTLYSVGFEQSYLTSGDKGDSPKDESFTASSSEGKSMRLELTFTYQYKAENVAEVFTRFKGQNGKAVRDTFIKPNIVSWTKEIVSKYTVADVLGEKRADVNSALTEYLAEKFEPYGITISNVSLINIEVDSKTQEAINEKIAAQQKAETQKINNQTAIDKAKADAEVQKTKAQAAADALLIEAQAKADANQLLQQSLSDKIIKQMYLEKWTGELPQVMSGENSSTMLNIDLNEKTVEE